jgi:hypothetical protein
MMTNEEQAPSLKATKIAFERRYSDDSGVEFGVSYSTEPWPGQIQFECVGKVQFPVQELDWLIACLQRIRAEIGENHG